MLAPQPQEFRANPEYQVGKALGDSRDSGLIDRRFSVKAYARPEKLPGYNDTFGYKNHSPIRIDA